MIKHTVICRYMDDLMQGSDALMRAPEKMLTQRVYNMVSTNVKLSATCILAHHRLELLQDLAKVRAFKSQP